MMRQQAPHGTTQTEQIIVVRRMVAGPATHPHIGLPSTNHRHVGAVMRLTQSLLVGALTLACLPAAAQTSAEVKRETVGNRITENVPVK